MNSEPSPAARRLQTLEKYLRQDPANPSLLADTFEAALAAGAHERAGDLVDAAERLGLDPAAWTFRRASACIARRDLEQAEALLRRLQSAGDHPAISHDLAHVRFLQADHAAACALVEPWLAAEGLAPAQREAVQLLWLRARHRLHLLRETWDWLVQADAEGRLQERAKGPASLIAVDTSHFEAALAWSEAALAADAQQVEALVARAYVAMAQRQPEAAGSLLERASRAKPDDGRIASALGYASLLAQDFPLAQAQLERALQAVPEHVGTWHALGWTRLLQGNTAGALEAFRAALELDRNFAESHGAVGLVLALRGDRPAAEQHLQLARRLDPRNVTGRYARGLLEGETLDADRLAELTRRLLDRPGPFGGKLSELVGDDRQ
jgi:tetratricopeptide (TPR) repeat protein